MPSSDLTHNPRGSVWHRWDPHLHAPGTLLNDQFQGNWDDYLQQIESSSPPIRALGVTDYFCIQTYRRVRELKSKGRLRDVELLFPNVEMRLDIKTGKKQPINLHLLFSPDDPDHEREIERILGQLKFEYIDRSYSCTLPEFTALGRKLLGRSTPEQAALRSGANQFKTTLSDLRELFRTELWMRKNCLVAVAGSSNDGTAGLQEDESYATTRQEIERFAHIIFASTPSQIEFWLGRTTNHDRKYIEKTYRALKPCLHGSDAHQTQTVGAPALNRLCWLKGDVTFEGLRQAVIEPADRVWIGSSPPSHSISSIAVSQVTTSGTPWLANKDIKLNSGLVAIVGARGSGKTALAEIVAKGAHASDAGQGSSSFLVRASIPVDHLGSASVQLEWTDGSQTNAHLSPNADEDSELFSEDTRYLSQHFVERLCSASGLATELRAEMERVVYEKTETTDRLETDSFEELLTVHVRPIADRRAELQGTIQAISDDIVKEDLLKAQLPGLKASRDTLKKQIVNAHTQLSQLVPKGKQERALRLAQLESACTNVGTKIEGLRRRRRDLDDLTAEVAHLLNSREPARIREMQRKFIQSELSERDWVAFQMVFKGDVDSILRQAKLRADLAIKAAVEESVASPIDQGKEPLDNWPLNLLVAKRDEVKKEVGVDALQQRKYNEVQRTLSEQETSLKRFEAQITHAEGAEGRRQALIASRRDSYTQIFETLVAEQKVLEVLYAPLGRDLAKGGATLAKLEFAVRRHVDLDKWVKTGESLLDFRKDSEFRGIGALRKHAELYLLSAWETGTADAVAAAMDTFRSKFAKDFLASIPNSIPQEERNAWNQSVASWLYTTDHIAIKYGIKYEGVAIEQLSPGTRGIVLLLLYLAVDLRDTRPLIIDQPEENLDPNSVFEELVPHFREARQRRQVIIVTHNANLVINTDADQVIVARSD
jgi:ABC-type lipoprotein export system ATPase subunit